MPLQQFESPSLVSLRIRYSEATGQSVFIYPEKLPALPRVGDTILIELSDGEERMGRVDQVIFCIRNQESKFETTIVEIECVPLQLGSEI